MSKKKKVIEPATELDWADDSKKPAQESVSNLAKFAEAAASVFAEEETDSEESWAVDAAEELLADEASESEELGEFNETDYVAPVAEEEEPGEIIDEDAQTSFSADGTELEGYSSIEIEEVERLADDQIISIIESLLFATDKPQSLTVLKQAFKGTNVRSQHLRRAIEILQTEYAGGRRGVYLEEVGGGFQLRTKIDNMAYLKRTVKSKPFRLSGPALEVLSIVAYKQPCIKSSIDEIRGVESGHLLRALMEKNLVHFEGKSELPGKPMLYGTTRRFLEIFGLRNLNELPSLSEIDDLIPQGIGEIEDKETLDDITNSMSKDAGTSYSEGEDELLKISQDLQEVATTTEFFEKEKERMREERDAERARDLREALAVGETIADADQRWLYRYDRDHAVTAAPEAPSSDAPTDSPVESEVQQQSPQQS